MVAAERVFKTAALGVGAVKHGNIFQAGAVFLHQLPDMLADPAGFFALRQQFAHFYRVAGGFIRKQALFFAFFVFGNQLVGGFQNYFGGAVILLQRNGFGVLKIFFKFQNVADVGPTPRINTLVRVPHHTQFAVFGGQHAGNHILGMVGVLVFVHQYILEKVLVIIFDVLVVTQQLHGFNQQIPKVQRAGGF